RRDRVARLVAIRVQERKVLGVHQRRHADLREGEVVADVAVALAHGSEHAGGGGEGSELMLEAAIVEQGKSGCRADADVACGDVEDLAPLARAALAGRPAVPARLLRIDGGENPESVPGGLGAQPISILSRAFDTHELLEVGGDEAHGPAQAALIRL